ncbi:MAG: Glyoxalase/Bleomycin resistance protein/Dioxygenase superfamily, partial [Solirubrobacterales bacterium]|nr:Glyoxalase/Bleomycin resistance protein/Dioxygenase superfamily [Solirubrobacterales bacterium]
MLLSGLKPLTYTPRMLELIDHVGVAVSDLDAAISLYEGTFGMPLVHR